MSTDLTDIGGIGPSTRDDLESIGITDISTFCRAYFLHPGQTVADVLHSPSRVHQHFFCHPAVDLGDSGVPDVPVPDAGLVAAMAFARAFGSAQTHTSTVMYDDPEERETQNVVPADLDWTETFLQDPGRNFGMVLNSTPSSEADLFNPLSIDTRPTSVTVDTDDCRVMYSTDDHTVAVDSRLLDWVMSFTGMDYTETEGLSSVRIHPTEIAPAYFHVGSAYPVAIAPLTPADGERTGTSSQTTQPASTTE